MPKNTEDKEFIRSANEYTTEEIVNNAMELLEWAQDAHWGVFPKVIEMLLPCLDNIQAEIFKVVSGSDKEWAYTVLVYLFDIPPKDISEDYIKFFKSRLAIEQDANIRELLSNLLNKQA